MAMVRKGPLFLHPLPWHQFHRLPMNHNFLQNSENGGYAAEELNVHSTFQGTPVLELQMYLCSPQAFSFHFLKLGMNIFLPPIPSFSSVTVVLNVV